MILLVTNRADLAGYLSIADERALFFTSALVDLSDLAALGPEPYLFQELVPSATTSAASRAAMM